MCERCNCYYFRTVWRYQTVVFHLLKALHRPQLFSSHKNWGITHFKKHWWDLSFVSRDSVILLNIKGKEWMNKIKEEVENNPNPDPNSHSITSSYCFHCTSSMLNSTTVNGKQINIEKKSFKKKKKKKKIKKWNVWWDSMMDGEHISPNSGWMTLKFCLTIIIAKIIPINNIVTIIIKLSYRELNLLFFYN